MTITSKEHYEMIEMFEKIFAGSYTLGSYRMDKEEKAMWSKGHVYQSAELNTMFLVFRQGVAYGKAVA